MATKNSKKVSPKGPAAKAPKADAAPAGEKKSGVKPRPSKASGKLSAINAAHQVLAKAREPMGAQELIKAMEDQGLWTSPGGKTPAATLYSATLREIGTKGAESRFKKAGPGRFAAK